MGSLEKQKIVIKCTLFNCKCHLHAHLSIVDQVLQWVAARELVHHLLVIGDGSCAGVLRANHARDVDVLNIGEVCKQSGSHLLSDL